MRTQGNWEGKADKEELEKGGRAQKKRTPVGGDVWRIHRSSPHEEKRENGQREGDKKNGLNHKKMSSDPEGLNKRLAFVLGGEEEEGETLAREGPLITLCIIYRRGAASVLPASGVLLFA